VCQHDREGAFGLVLNRPSETMIGDALAADLPENLKGQPIYIGGPVQATAMSFLHSDVFLPKASVMPNLNMDHSLDNLVELGQSYSPTQKVKIFAGYSGWSAGQLDEEMRREAWLTYPATLELVFNTEPHKLWTKILRKKGPDYRLIAEMPEDLSWN
jgi:putative transcriptional regulator